MLCAAHTYEISMAAGVPRPIGRISTLSKHGKTWHRYSSSWSPAENLRFFQFKPAQIRRVLREGHVRQYPRDGRVRRKSGDVAFRGWDTPDRIRASVGSRRVRAGEHRESPEHSRAATACRSCTSCDGMQTVSRSHRWRLRRPCRMGTCRSLPPSERIFNDTNTHVDAAAATPIGRLAAEYALVGNVFVPPTGFKNSAPARAVADASP